MQNDNWIRDPPSATVAACVFSDLRERNESFLDNKTKRTSLLQFSVTIVVLLLRSFNHGATFVSDTGYFVDFSLLEREPGAKN